MPEPRRGARRTGGGVENPDVVIVAANIDAYREYKRYAAYTCQPGRAFAQEPRWMAFYADGVVKPEIPEITYVRDRVPFSPAEVERLRSQDDPISHDLAHLIEVLLATSTRRSENDYKVMFLTPADDPRTFVLEQPVENVHLDHAGSLTAFVQKQRYTRMDWLQRHPKTTADLIATPDEEDGT